MSTVKISQLPNLTKLDSNTSNTIMVGIDVSTSVTSQFTARVLADSLYSNTALNVGNNAIILPNVIAQFIGNSSNYLQTNLQNRTSDGSADYVITADVGTDERNYIDLGLAGSTDADETYTSVLPLDGYLYVQGNTATGTGGNLIIGTTTAGRTVNIIAGGPGSDKIAVKISTNGMNLISKPLTFADGSSQNTSTESTGPFANSAFVRANSSFGVANSAALYANGAFGASNSASLYANGAFAASNSASLYANGAFEASNSASSYANSGFGAANSASLYANGAFIQANAVFSRSNNQVWPQANAAFGTANSGSLYANAAFIQANAVFDRSNNQVWPQANAAFNSSNTVGVYANAAFGAANSASLYANGAFTAANVATSAALYANGAFGSANSAGVFANGAFINSNNAYTTANSGGLYANGAFGAANSAGQYANAAFSKANSAYTLAGTQAGRLDVIEPIAQAAFTNAASALQNTSGTFDGTMYIAGGLSVNGTVLFANSRFSETESAVTISASPTVATPSNDGYMIHISGKNGVASRVVTDSYGTGAYSLYAGRAARGTVSSPTALQSGDVIARFSGNGYGTTKYQTLGVGRIDFIAAENFTDTATGSQIKFWNCPIGSNTLTNIATFNGDSATFTGLVNPQKGFIYTPRLPAGNQTAITIDYATDSTIKANLVADLTVSHSNFIAGKVVEIWLVNVDNANHTVTHGCAALRSTNKSTTATITSGSSMYLRYFSIDGDLANTFVSING